MLFEQFVKRQGAGFLGLVLIFEPLLQAFFRKLSVSATVIFPADGSDQL
jgi:hypothetical protein